MIHVLSSICVTICIKLSLIQQLLIVLNCFNCVLHLSIHRNSHYSSSTHITADVEYNSGVTQAKRLTLFFTFLA